MKLKNILLSEGPVSISDFKVSRASMLMKIYSYRTKWQSMEFINNILNKATKNSGVPGCGKTYSILT